MEVIFSKSPNCFDAGIESWSVGASRSDLNIIYATYSMGLLASYLTLSFLI